MVVAAIARKRKLSVRNTNILAYQSILPLNGKNYVENKFKKKCAGGDFDCNMYCLPYKRLRKENCKVRKIDYWYSEQRLSNQTKP